MTKGAIIGIGAGAAVAATAAIVVAVKAKKNKTKKEPGVTYYTIQNAVKTPLIVDGETVKRKKEVAAGTHVFKYTKQELSLDVNKNMTFKGESEAGVPLYE